jgi:hypothetical protein
VPRDTVLAVHDRSRRPGTGALLNQVLLVQSKAQDRRFAFEDEHSFRYLCDQRDLDLWLSGNAR